MGKGIVQPAGTGLVTPLTLVFAGATATLGSPYAGGLTASGGVSPYTYSISAGALPNSVTLNPATGQLTGSPSVAGVFTFTGQVVDSSVGGSPVTVSGTITVANPSSAPGAAPNVTGSGAVTVTYPVYGGIQHWRLQVAVTLPTTNFANLAQLMLYVNGPTGAGATTVLIGGPYNAVNVPGWAAGATVNLLSVDLGPNVPGNTAENYCAVVAVNAANVPTASPYQTGSFTVLGYLGTAGAEYGNATLSSVAFNPSLDASGNEIWEVSAVCAPPLASAAPLWGQSQGVLMETAIVAASKSWSSISPFTLQVKPWVPNGAVTNPAAWTCSVASDGVTITNINPKVSSGVATVATNGYILIAGTVYGTVSWSTDGSGCILLAGSGAPAGTQNFATQEFRYGAITAANSPNAPAGYLGDLIWIDGYQFHVTSLGTWGNNGQSNWTLTPLSASGSVATNQYILDISSATGGVDGNAGSLYPGQTSAVSDAYPMGAPSAYSYILVGENVYGAANTWPVAGVTPGLSSAGVPLFTFGAEVQKTGSLLTSRLDPTQIGAGLTGGGGSPLQSASTPGTIGDFVLNGGFESLPAGSCWVAQTAGLAVNVIGSAASPQGFNSPCCLKVPANVNAQIYQALQTGAAYNNNIKITPSQSYVLSAFTKADAGTNGSATVTIVWFNGATELLIQNIPYVNSTVWTNSTAVFTAPAGATSVWVYAANNTAGTTGNWYVDDITFAALPQGSSGVGYDAFGNLISTLTSAGVVLNGTFEALPYVKTPGVGVGVGAGYGTDWVFRNSCSYIATGVPTYTGLAAGVVNAPGGGNYSQIYSSNYIAVTPGQVYTMTVWVYAPSAVAGGTFALAVVFYANGVNTNATIVGSGIVPSSTWTQYALTFTVPVTTPATNQMILYPADWAGGTSGTVYIDNVVCTLAPTVAPGGALAVNAAGSLIVNAGGALAVVGSQLVLNASGALAVVGSQLLINSGSLNVSYFQAGSQPTYSGTFSQNSSSGSVNSGSSLLTLGSSFGSMSGWFVTGPGVKPGTVVSSNSGTSVTLSQLANQTISGTYYFVNLPPASGTSAGTYSSSNPTGTVPAGGWLFNLTNRLMYQNLAGSWHIYGDPGDLVAGSIAAGVGYFGAIAALQITAGTISAAITLTSPTLVITGSNFTLNVDNTNSLRLTAGAGNAFPGATIHLDPVAMAVSLAYTSGSDTHNSIVTPGLITTNLVISSSVVQESQLNEDGITAGASPGFNDLMLHASTGLFKLSNLPSSSPGLGSKQFWYDPSDSDRVKFAA